MKARVPVLLQVPEDGVLTMLIARSRSMRKPGQDRLSGCSLKMSYQWHSMLASSSLLIKPLCNFRSAVDP